MARRSNGFTLLELLIIVAILGLLASFALYAYRDYVQASERAKVQAHYDNAVNAVRSRLIEVKARASMGPVLDFPVDAAAWIGELNPDATLAPGGGPAYVAGAGDGATGAVGIDVSGTWADRDVAVTIERPGYLGLAGQTNVLAL